MKKTLKKFGTGTLLMLTICGAKVALAGERGGNGGNIGVCFSNSAIVKEINASNNRISNSQIQFITSVTPLDLYEARAAHDSEGADQNLMLPKSDESPYEYTTRMINRFDYLPDLKKILKEKLVTIQKNPLYYNDGGIDRIYDTNEAYYLDPEKCVIATAIRQSLSQYGEVKLEFDNRLFNFKKGSQSSRNTQGVLILHETVLRWALDIGHKDAKNARELTAYFLQKNIGRQDLVKKLRNLGFLGSILKGGFGCNPDDSAYDSLRIVAADGTEISNYGCTPSEFAGSDLLSSSLRNFKSKIYTRLGKNGDTAEGSLVSQSLREMVGGEMQMKLPAGYLKGLKEELDVGRFGSDFQGVYLSLNHIQKEKNPNCPAMAPAGAIAEIESKIKLQETGLSVMKKKLSRAVFGKKKIQAEIDSYEWWLRSYNVELTGLRKADADFTKCQVIWSVFKAKYQTSVKKVIEDERDIIQEIVFKRLKEIEKKKWMTEASKGKARSIIEACESSIMGVGDFSKACLQVNINFNEANLENPTTED